MLEANLSLTNGIPVIGRLTQWDHGQAVKLTGLNVTSDTEVHFANEGTKEAIIMLGKYIADDVSLEVEVPDISLQKPRDILVFIYQATETEGRTIRIAKIEITPRPKPTNYKLPETKDYLMKVLNDVEAFISGDYNVSDAQIEAALTKYLSKNPINGEDGKDGASIISVSIKEVQ